MSSLWRKMSGARSRIRGDGIASGLPSGDSGGRAGRATPGPTGRQVPLRSDCVRFREPSPQLVVDLAEVVHAEGVEVVARRERLDRSESRVLQPAGEHDVSIEPSPPWRDLRERHANLEG